MQKTNTITVALLGLLLFAGCYTDDSTPPNPARLPFENFDEFFSDNNQDIEGFLFHGNEAVDFSINPSLHIFIPDNAIPIDDSVQMDMITAFNKSDFILLNKPTLSGDVLLESIGAFNLQMRDIAGVVEIDNPIEVNMNLENGQNVSDLLYYKLDDDWLPDNDVSIIPDMSSASFETTQQGWQMLAKEFVAPDLAEITITPFGYGTVPIDVKAFAVLDNYNVVFALNADVDNVSVSGKLPKNISLTIVIMVMDNFKLSVGTLSTVIDSAGELELGVDLVELNEMIEIIKDLD